MELGFHASVQACLPEFLSRRAKPSAGVIFSQLDVWDYTSYTVIVCGLVVRVDECLLVETGERACFGDL